jgi:phosphatidylglycerol---prolipoprotein diacylglyceryl transferase
MKPILFQVFDFDVPSYSVLMVLGYIVALLVLFKLTPKSAPGTIDSPDGELNRPQVWDLFIVMVVSSVIGSKLGHVLFEASSHVDDQGRPLGGVIDLLKTDPWHWARLGEPGYVWYGGMLGALITALVYFKRRPKLRAWLYADAFAPAIMAGAAIGRVGCFLAGCCYGKPTNAPWGLAFPDTHGVPVHPTQLYDALVAASLGAFLMWRFGRRRFEGENIALLLMAYAILRSVTEVFRGDPERGGLGAISTSQLISIPLFALGVFLYVWLSKRPRAETPGAVVAADLS